jgi:methionyl-tRNA formyltransferase
MPYRLVFFGTEAFSVPTLEALIGAGYDIAAIVTKPDTVRGRGKKTFVHPVKQIGLEHNIPVLQPTKLADSEPELIALHADAAVLVSYGKIIPRRILDVFEPIGIINIHPSRLPQFRGPSPIEATILSGQTSTAVSIMKLDEGMDTGPLFTQTDVSLSGAESKPELSEHLAVVGAQALLETLPDILSGTLQPKSQNNSDVSITSLIFKADGVLDPTTDDALTLERKIRAYQGYPKPHLIIENTDVIITSAKTTLGPEKGILTIPCAHKTWLEVTSLIAPSGRTMHSEDFLRGYANKVS